MEIRNVWIVHEGRTRHRWDLGERAFPQVVGQPRCEGEAKRGVWDLGEGIQARDQLQWRPGVCKECIPFKEQEEGPCGWGPWTRDGMTRGGRAIRGQIFRT